MKIVINRCYGGFGLSEAAYDRLAKVHGVPVVAYTDGKDSAGVIYDHKLSADEKENRLAETRLFGRYWDTWTSDARADSRIIEVVETLGKLANGACADLRVIEIPDGIEVEVEEYDGLEHVAERHRTWP